LRRHRQALRLSLFQVASIISTTGFSTADFNLWPVFSKILLVSLMLAAVAPGSTGGGLKVSRPS
jgi:trk system potassium uptake protein TrkH